MQKSKLFIARGEQLNQEVTGQKGRAEEISEAMLNHLERFHSLNEIFDKDVEEAILENELNHVRNPKKPIFEKGLVTFSPSSASKCQRELYYKAKREQKDEQQMFPYQRRWVRNGSAIHAAVQKDLLLAEVHLKNPAFTVEKMPDGSAAWEHNLKDVKQMEHNGVRFQLFGMMDGILKYHPKGNGNPTRIGFEFKTKSTTLGAIGHYKMKDAQDSHKMQEIAYAHLFELDEFIMLYESLAKDGWNKGGEAKPDMRAFYFKPTNDQKEQLLDKFAHVAAMVEHNVLPMPEYDKCLFCPFKEKCAADGL